MTKYAGELCVGDRKGSWWPEARNGDGMSYGSKRIEYWGWMAIERTAISTPQQTSLWIVDLVLVDVQTSEVCGADTLAQPGGLFP